MTFKEFCLCSAFAGIFACIFIVGCQTPEVMFDAKTDSPIGCASEDTEWLMVPIKDKRCSIILREGGWEKVMVQRDWRNHRR